MLFVESNKHKPKCVCLNEKVGGEERSKKKLQPTFSLMTTNVNKHTESYTLNDEPFLNFVFCSLQISSLRFCFLSTLSFALFATRRRCFWYIPKTGFLFVFHKTHTHTQTRNHHTHRHMVARPERCVVLCRKFGQLKTKTNRLEHNNTIKTVLKSYFFMCVIHFILRRCENIPNRSWQKSVFYCSIFCVVPTQQSTGIT